MPNVADVDSQPLSRLRRLLSSEWALLFAITALAAALRLYALDRLPPGLYHDEAYNGLDALGVLQGARPIFFEANNGREPLFIYLVALSISLLGRSPLAIRLVAAVLGVLTVPATYLIAHELLGRRVGLLTALVAATTFWHLNLSRVGFRAVSLPLFTALWLWLFVRGWHQRCRRDWVLSGVCLGLSLYTYLAARFAPLVLVLLIAYWRWRRQPIPWRGLVLVGVSACLVAAPLLMYALSHLDAFLERSAQVSILNPAINGGDFGGTLLRHLLKTLAMFNWRGDFIPRHNLPLRPVFDPLMGLFFLVGLAISVRAALQRTEYALPLLYGLVMLLPSVLAEGAPHFLRAVGILPVLFVFPAAGLASGLHWLEARVPRWAALAMVGALIGLSLYRTASDYFLRHAPSEAVYYNFESGAAELAADINRFLGTGWQSGAHKGGIAAQPPSRYLYLDERLWRDWASLRYLVPESASLTLVRDGVPTPPVTADEVRLVVWPYVDSSQHLGLLPRNSLVSVREGPLERGDLEKESRLLSVTYEAAPLAEVPNSVQARFEQGIELLGYEWSSLSNGTLVCLFWRAQAELGRDYTVFVHLLRNEQQVTQSDSYPARGRYATHLWRPGDVVSDEHLLDVAVAPGEGYSLLVGLYSLETMARLRVLDAEGGEPIGDAVTIRLP